MSILDKKNRVYELKISSLCRCLGGKDRIEKSTKKCVLRNGDCK